MAIGAILAGASIATGLYTAYKGAQEGQKGRDAAKSHYKKMAADIEALTIPELKELALKDPKYLGDIAPLLSKEKFSALDLPEEITTDPRFRQAQMDTMSTLEAVSKEGMTEQDQLNLENIRQRNDRDASASRKAAMQSMAERGMGGAGAELAQSLQAEQATAQNRGMQGLQLAADKRNAAMQAMMQRGQMAGQMRGQEFGEQSANQQARIAREEFNKSMAQDVQQRNVAAERQATYRDMGERQRLEEGDAARRAQEEVYNIGRDERKYQMELDKAKAKHGVASGQAGVSQADAAAKAGQWGAIGQAAIGGAKAYGDYSAAGDAKIEAQKDRDSAEKIAALKARK